MSLVLIGRLGRPHGLKGELTLDTSLDPAELEQLREVTWRGKRGDTRPLTMTAVRPGGARLLVTVAGVHDREHAAPLVNGELMVEAERLPDPGPGVAYTFQLVGLDVRTEEGRSLGSLADVLATGAHPVYVVKGEREILIPATPEVVLRVDLTGRSITVRLPAGLEEIQ